MRPRRVVRVVSLAVLLAGAAICWDVTAAAAQSPPPQMPVRVGGAIQRPTKIKDVRPVYPDVAANARVQGVVILEITVGTNGKVVDGRVLRGVPLLDQAALDAVRQWEFTPTLLNGVPVPVIMTATVNFSLMPEGAISSTEESTSTPLTSTATPLLTDEEARREPFLLAQRRAGLLQVGMSVDTLFRRIPANQRKLVDLSENAHFTPAIEIRLEPGDAQPAVVARYRFRDGWMVWMLEVQDSHFRTADGLGVGSTLADIHAVLPAAKAVVGQATRAVPVVVLRDRGLILQLDASGVTGRNVPETAAVTRVLVTEIPPPAPWPAVRPEGPRP